MAGKWTLGPWEARFRFGRKTTVAGRQRYPICDTSTAPLGEANERRDEANAQLIAAAPALYEALVFLVADVLEYERVNNLAPNPGRQDCWDSVTRAKAALYQALGEGQ